MSVQDPPEPFQDPDATMLVPTPGGRRAAPSAAPAAPVAVAPGSGLNPLVRAANPLLALVVPLRMTPQPPDLQQLRERLVLAVRAFESEARAAGIDSEAIAAARYALCTLLDETIAGTAWGSGAWGTRSLLVSFHNEASGGEKVFVILQRLSQNAGANIDLLELIYLCLSLGLEGRYRLIERGHEQLATLRERLLQLIRQQRGAYESDLSPQWRGEAVQAPTALRRIPLWVLAAAACALLVAAQLVASVLLSRASDPVFAGLSKIRAATLAVAAPLPAAAPAPTSRLAGFLAPEVAKELVSVRETAERSVVTVRGDGMFASGSAEPQDKLAPLLARIGDALRTLPGKIVVIGHTDDTKPDLSARFPSNYDLSKARAASVMAALAQRAGPPARYSVEARGDTEPLVVNDTPAHRARNRRVDIVILTPAVAP